MALLQLTDDPNLSHPFTARALKSLTAIGEMFRDWISMRDRISVGDLLDTILEGIDYRRYLDDGTEEGRDRWANVMELRGVASEYEDLDLSGFLEQVALVSDIDDLEEDPNAPTLLTLHAAKGLEFPVVFIVGLEEGMLPHSRSLDDAEMLSEERRLFYVGLTRAQDRLFLSHAFRRTFYGGTEVATPSRFLLDIPGELLEGGSSGSRREKTKRRASSWNWSAAEPSATSRQTGGLVDKSLPEPRAWSDPSSSKRGPVLAEAQYRTGQKVRHAKFGEGIVVESKLTGNDEEVVVAFTGLGIKKLLASLAKLEERD